MRASPIQQASAYSTFANGGKRVDAHRVRKVVRRSDKKEFKTNAKTYDIISEQAAWMISQLLEKVVSGGYQNYNEILASNYTVYGKSVQQTGLRTHIKFLRGLPKMNGQ